MDVLDSLRKWHNWVAFATDDRVEERVVISWRYWSQ